jgi:hypothetical protein
MDNKTRPSEVYTAINLNNAGSEEEYTIGKEVENNLQWGKESTTIELFHIVEMDQRPTSERSTYL